MNSFKTTKHIRIRYILGLSAVSLLVTTVDETEFNMARAQLGKTIHKMGILIELDDFGTGYSSLNLLKNLPINTLKHAGIPLCAAHAAAGVYCLSG